MSILYDNDFECLRNLISLFKIFGLATFYVEFTKTEVPNVNLEELNLSGSYTAVLYNILLILLISGINFLSLLKLFANYKTVTLFHIVDYFQICFGTFVTFFILIFHCYYQKEVLKLVEKIYKVKMKINELNTIHKKKKSIFCIETFIISQLLLVLCLLISAVIFFEDIQLLLASALRNTVVNWLLFQYGVIVKILLNMIQKINKTIIRMVKSAGDIDRLVLVSTNEIPLLLSIRDSHYYFLEICQEVEKLYEFVILGSIAYIFVCMVVFSYFLIGLVIDGKINFPIIDYTHFFLWLLCFSSSLVLLSRYVNDIIVEVSL